MKFAPKEFLAQLPKPANEKWKDGVRFTETFAKGEFELEFFAPRDTDYQTPHDKDEFYIIVSGMADLLIEGEKFPCEVGDALFVEAKCEHHFENISEDFATWVIFFGKS